MGKKNKIKRNRSLRRNNQKWVETVLNMLPYAFSLTLLGSLIGGSYAYAVQSDLFSLKSVVIENYRASSSYERFRFAGLSQGEWLLSVNLQEVQGHIQRYHPEYQEVTVRRVLPNQIHIELKERLPIARIYWDRYYWIDSKGVVLSPDKSKSGKEVPIILGVPRSKKAVTMGSRVHFRALDQAIRILQDIKQKNIFQKHRLTHMDISDTRNFVLRMDGKIDIRMGSRNFANKIRKLAEAVDSLDLDPKKVRYIDLRFDDIIIGPR